MEIISRLPTHIQRHIYEYDGTFKEKYDYVIKVLSNKFPFIGRRFRFWTYHNQIYECYWGSFTVRSMFDYIHFKSVFDNRNKFVRDYEIIKYQKPRRNTCETLETIPYEHIDHVEWYKNKNGDFIHVFSKYISNDDYYFIYQKYGYTEIYPLYNKSQKTFIKIIPKSIQKCKKYKYDYENTLLQCSKCSGDGINIKCHYCFCYPETMIMNHCYHYKRQQKEQKEMYKNDKDAYNLKRKRIKLNTHFF